MTPSQSDHQDNTDNELAPIAPALNAPASSSTPKDQPSIFYTAMAGGVGVLLLGVVVAWIFQIPLHTQLKLSVSSIIIGVIVTLPLLALLAWFMKTSSPALAAFRESQLEFMANIGFDLTPARIVAMSIIAGVGEEVLFRGALQGVAERFLPLALALVLPNILFGALHARTALYAIIAGVLGLYLSIINWITDTLWPVMIAHTLYDIAAFEITRRMITQRNKSRTDLV